jgi:hypothetical protein
MLASSWSSKGLSLDLAMSRIERPRRTLPARTVARYIEPHPIFTSLTGSYSLPSVVEKLKRDQIHSSICL